MTRHRTWLQTFYHDFPLKSETLLGSLWDQLQALREVRSALTQGDRAALAKAAAALEVDLLRFACAALRARLEEAAWKDCAQLIADSVLDVADPAAAEQWTQWLAAAPYWPPLARAQWHHAVIQAANLVLDTLRGGGLDLDPKATEEIEAAMAALELQDLLPAEAYARFFPAALDEAETA
ncbi:MAG: hypothetical protein ACM3VY_00495 [Candidatus Bathyarchaeota archaeon]